MKKRSPQVWPSSHLARRLDAPDLLVPLILRAGNAFALLAISVVLGYICRVLLARWLGVAEYGTYEYILNAGIFLGQIAALGLPNAVLRFIPEYTVLEDWPRLRGLVWSSWLAVAISGLAIAGLVTLLAPILGASTSVPPGVWVWGGWCVPLLALSRHQLELAKALKKLPLAYLPSLLASPVMVAGGTWVYLLLGNPRPTHTLAIGIFIISLFLGLAWQWWQIQKHLPHQVWLQPPQILLHRWLGVALPMLLADGAFVILAQTDTLMIGAWLGEAAVGIYTAAAKTAAWVSFILMAFNAISAPMFSALYARGDLESLQKLVHTSAKWTFFPAATIALLLIIFAEPTLGIFGSEFVVARWEMTLLITGQLVNVGAGSVGYLMQMTGHQWTSAYIFGCSALLNLVLNALLIPILGTLGAAFSTALTMMLWNIWLRRQVIRQVGVTPSIVDVFR